jgi:hypothetical protein
MSTLNLKKRLPLLLLPLLCAEPFLAQQNPPVHSPQSAPSPSPKPTETWRYRHIEGIGDDVKIHFEYNPQYDDYVLTDADRDLLARASSAPQYDGILHFREIRFRDLESMVVARIVRNQVRITAQTEFALVTLATTLLKVYIQIHCESCNRKAQDAIAYPLFVRATTNKGRVIQTSEFTVNMPAHDGSKSDVTASTRVDMPLMPGAYELAIATKNPSTGADGVMRTQLDVPTNESLGMKD